MIKPNKPSPDNGDFIAQLRISQADAVQGDGAHGGKRAGFKIDAVRQVRDQVFGDQSVFSVNGMAAAGANHAVAGLETRYILSGFNNRAAG